MKVLLVNCSPNKNGCTYTALNEIKNTLNEENIEADFYWIGKKTIGGCIACYKCDERASVYLMTRLMSLRNLQRSMTASSSARLSIMRE